MKQLFLTTVLVVAVSIGLNYLYAFMAEDSMAARLLMVPGGGLLSPGGGWQRSGTNVTLGNNSDTVGIGTSTPASGAEVAVQSDQGTSTLYLVSQDTLKGGCIQIEGAKGTTTFHTYATSTGPLYLQAGTCK